MSHDTKEIRDIETSLHFLIGILLQQSEKGASSQGRQVATGFVEGIRWFEIT